MEKFQFVTLTHPRGHKEKKNQVAIRAHAIRNTIQKARQLAAHNNDNFFAVEIDESEHRPVKRTRKRPTPINDPSLRSPSVSCLDPFDTLPTCSNRLQQLIYHKAAKQAGEPIFTIHKGVVFQNFDKVCHGALTDPALYHSLILSLVIAVNDGNPDAESISYRGAAMSYINKRLSNTEETLSGSTVLAILMLLGVEYRTNGASRNDIEIHLRAIFEIVRLCGRANIFLCSAIKRAIFWQDLISSFVVRTPRYFSHDSFPELHWERDQFQESLYTLPTGFQGLIGVLKPNIVRLLEDINAMSIILDSRCMCGGFTINEMHTDNAQAYIESRLTIIRNEINSIGNEPIHESCIYAAYLCTYKLSTKMWEASFIPSFCSFQLLSILQNSELDPWWNLFPDLLTWLLFIGGSFAEKKLIRLQYMALMHGSYRSRLGNSHQSWAEVKNIVHSFIWSESNFEQPFKQFWEETHPC